MRTRAFLFDSPGGIDVLKWRERAIGSPAPGEVCIKQAAVGVNFIDVYQRTGLYSLPLPSGIGMEGAGTVIALGHGVSHFKVGDRVVYAGGPVGAYAEIRNYPAERLLHLPDSIDFDTAAAMLFRGLTVAYLLKRTYPLRPGDTVLVHAAAGGVGQIAAQWAKAIGATVIGTVGTATKVELARRCGCDHVINYREENFVERVLEITRGDGVSVVYDSVGKDTFMGSLDCLRKFGMMVGFGSASGAIPEFDPRMLTQKGSLYFARPSVMHHIAKREDMVSLADELFDMVESGKLKIKANHVYPLFEAPLAHNDLQGRKTTGSIILRP